jgi:hypothetical protein
MTVMAWVMTVMVLGGDGAIEHSIVPGVRGDSLGWSRFLQAVLSMNRTNPIGINIRSGLLQRFPIQVSLCNPYSQKGLHPFNHLSLILGKL